MKRSGFLHFSGFTGTKLGKRTIFFYHFTCTQLKFLRAKQQEVFGASTFLQKGGNYV